jgi:UDP-glucose 4-epimerase
MIESPLTIVGAASPLGRHLVGAASGPVCAVVRDCAVAPFEWQSRGNIELVAANLRDEEAVRRAVAGSESIVWLAHATEEGEVDVNARALRAACEMRPARLVFVSSGGSVYGEPEILPVPEWHPRHPLSLYGQAKKAMEQVALAHAWHTRIAVLRPGNIYGREYLAPGAKGAVGAFAGSLMRAEPVVLIRDGIAARDFLHAADVLQAIELALRAPSGTIWNVGSGLATPIAELLTSVCAIVGLTPVAIEQRPPRAWDVNSIALATARIRAEAGWSPRYDLETGLREVLATIAAGPPLTRDRRAHAGIVAPQS